MKKIHLARSAVMLALALALLVVVCCAQGCTRPTPKSQLDAAQGVVVGLDVAVGAFCSDNPWLGRPPALTTDAPEPTVMGYVQAARAWLCADPFRDLIDGARDLLRRAEAAPPAPPPDRTPEAPTGRPRAQEAEPSDVEPPEGLDPQTLRPSDPPAPEHPTQGDGGVPSEADAGGVRP